MSAESEVAFAPPILVAGMAATSLVSSAPMLQRGGHLLEERWSSHELIHDVAASGARLVVLGSELSDLPAPEVIRRIRGSPETRRVSVLVLLPAAAPASLEEELREAGANLVLRHPPNRAQLERGIARLLAVPRRVEARVPVEGHVVGTPRDQGQGHFVGLTRNLSIHGVLLASPVRLPGPELDLQLDLPGCPARLSAYGRVVREAHEVAGPYLGYGVEFVEATPETLDAITELVGAAAASAGRVRADELIHCTLRRDSWIYEILEPVPRDRTWRAEIRRASHEAWRPGRAVPYHRVEGATPDAALREAREFVRLHG